MRTRWLGAPLGVLAFIACSGQTSKHPPDLGGCLNAQEGCTTPASGAGAGDTPADAGDEEDASTITTSTCGTAGTIVANETANPDCSTCVDTNCCLADTACTTSCLTVLQCILACTAGNTTCVSGCESDPTGSLNYGDFQACVVASCGSCPALQR